MKENEAPKKIYVNFHFTETHPGYSPMVTKQGLNKYDVVYVRTDAFIEKATEWLTKHAHKYYFNKERYLGTEELVEDFKISMEL